MTMMRQSTSKADMLLSGIANSLVGLTDPSSTVNGWQTVNMETISITGSTAPTNATVTGTSISVKGCSTMTVLYDMTGNSTGVVLTFRGGVSGFSMQTLRQVTASAPGGGFRLGNATTGGTQDTTGISRIDDFNVSVGLAVNTGAGTGVALVTVKTRLLLQPSS